MYRPLRPIRPDRVSRAAGAPLVRGRVAGGAAYAAGHGAEPPGAGPSGAVPSDEPPSGAVPSDEPPSVAVSSDAPPSGSGTPVGSAELTGRLVELGGMMRLGLLTPEEFAAAKARLFD